MKTRILKSAGAFLLIEALGLTVIWCMGNFTRSPETALALAMVHAASFFAAALIYDPSKLL